MKKQSYGLFATLSREDMADLTAEVKETIAFGLVQPVRRLFTSAELWNIHRQVKTKALRRNI